MWRMPAEWEPHERTWMAWPSGGYTLGDSPKEAEDARRAWASVALAIAGFEPVTMVVDDGAAAIARSYLDASTSHPITIIEVPLDDAWMRDIGPSFVIDGDRIASVDWTFNGWGAQSWATWDKDARIAESVARRLNIDIIHSSLVNEGGAFHVDGAGRALITQTVALDPGRNPTWTRAEVDDELRRTLGVDTVTWLSRGLTRDYEEFGTRGHVDMVAAFTPSGRVLLHDQREPEHPDHAVTALIHGELTEAGFDVVSLPAPTVLRDDEGWVDYTYVNHYVVNGGVILCAFDDPADEVAASILQQEYPGRDVVLVDAREIFARGGGIHCITQQQPAVRR